MGGKQGRGLEWVGWVVGICKTVLRPCVIMGNEDGGRNQSINNGGKGKNVGWGDQGRDSIFQIFDGIRKEDL